MHQTQRETHGDGEPFERKPVTLQVPTGHGDHYSYHDAEARP